MSELLLGEVDDEGLCLSTVSISMCATPATPTGIVVAGLMSPQRS